MMFVSSADVSLLSEGAGGTAAESTGFGSFEEPLIGELSLWGVEARGEYGGSSTSSLMTESCTAIP